MAEVVPFPADAETIEAREIAADIRARLNAMPRGDGPIADEFRRAITDEYLMAEARAIIAQRKKLNADR